MTNTALVLGATGGIGGATAAALLAHGWRIRALTRDPAGAATRLPGLAQIEWVAGDAMNASDVMEASAGVTVIVHGVNPPKYRNWRGLALPMLSNTIEAAKARSARIFFPGNLYNFGRDAGAVVNETSPQTPRSRKGAIRVEMEDMLKQAADDGVRVLIVRAGDFFGANAPGSWFSSVMIRPGRPVRSVTYPGAPDVGHSWAYLPDLAETIARLLDCEADLANFEVFHFGGNYFERGIEMAEAVRRVAGKPDAPIKRLQWLAVSILSPAVPLFRELNEMRYLWQEPLRLDNAKLVAFLGDEPHTPLDEALHEVLSKQGCLA
jgi:nucleoside-diphosphate-sugar epimerase